MKARGRLAHWIAIAIFMLLPVTVVAQERADVDKAIAANVGQPAKVQSFIAELRHAVAKHDAPAVAARVSYPITVNPRTNKALRIRTPEAFVASYERIVTPHIAKVVEDQKYEQLFVNYQGAMFGSGEVWIAGICKDKECRQSEIKIKTIQNTAGSK